MQIEKLMNEIIELYPNHKWHIDYHYLNDAGNELTPYCFIGFGKEIDGNFESLIIDEHGKKKCYSNELTDFDNVYECALFSYESNIDDLFLEIYNNIIMRLNKE